MPKLCDWKLKTICRFKSNEVFCKYCFYKTESGIRVLETGCDVGTATNLLAQHFPKSTVIGIDINEHAMQKAKDAAASKNLKNVCYDKQNIYKMPEDWAGKFDHAYAIDTIHGVRPADALKEISRVLAPTGTFNLIEMNGNAGMTENKDLKSAPYLYVSDLVLSMQDMGDHEHGDEDAGSHGDEEKKGGGDKGAADESEVEGTCGEGPSWWWGKEAIFKAVKEAGFREVERHDIAGSYVHVVYVCRK